MLSVIALYYVVGQIMIVDNPTDFCPWKENGYPPYYYDGGCALLENNTAIARHYELDVNTQASIEHELVHLELWQTMKDANHSKDFYTVLNG